jgi:Predicted Zn-dependent peptidases
MHTILDAARRGAWLSCVAGAFALRATFAQAPVTVRPLPFTRVQLANGLVALFNEDHSSPIVGVGVWYHVGAKDEQAGHTGLAHLCEHMLFEGSPNVAPGQFEQIIRAGGGTSYRWAETSEDRTFYYETVPSNMLETTLWLESDRMAAPFTGTDSARLDVVRGAIKNERQTYIDNRTFGTADNITLSTLYGGEHPYRTPLGPMDDLNRATFAEMKKFCAPFYVPNNAIVALSGDFETAKAKAMVEKYFGPIARGAPVSHPVMRPTPLSADRRIVLEDPRARVARLRIAWSGAGFANPDKLALNALAAVLQGDRSSGLVKALVYDRQLATFVYAAHIDVENGGVFQIEATPRGNTSLGEIEDVIDSVVRTVRDTRPSERALERFKNAYAVTAVTSLQGRLFRVDTLAQGEGWAHDPVAYAKQVNQAARLTPADVQRAAQKYLGPGRVVMSMVPAGKPELVSKPERKSEKYSSVVPEKR